MSITNAFLPGASITLPQFSPLFRRQTTDPTDPTIAEAQRVLGELSGLVLEIGTTAPTCLNLGLIAGQEQGCTEAPAFVTEINACNTAQSSEQPTLEEAARNLECICEIVGGEELEGTLRECSETVCEEGEDREGSRAWIDRVKNEAGVKCEEAINLVREVIGEEEEPNTVTVPEYTTATLTIDGTPTTVTYGIATAPVDPSSAITTATTTDEAGEEVTTTFFPNSTTTTGEDRPDDTESPTPTGTDDPSGAFTFGVKKGLMFAAMGLPVLMAVLN